MDEHDALVEFISTQTAHGRDVTAVLVAQHGQFIKKIDEMKQLTADDANAMQAGFDKDMWTPAQKDILMDRIANRLTSGAPRSRGATAGKRWQR